MISTSSSGYADVVFPDPITSRFQGYADVWHDIVGWSNDEVARRVREDGVDVLVDLTLHTSHRLLIFAQKPAPVQVSFAAYPGTTGLATMDYRLTDPYLDPPGETDADYTERSDPAPEFLVPGLRMTCGRVAPSAPPPRYRSQGADPSGEAVVAERSSRRRKIQQFEIRSFMRFSALVRIQWLEALPFVGRDEAL